MSQIKTIYMKTPGDQFNRNYVLAEKIKEGVSADKKEPDSGVFIKAVNYESNKQLLEKYPHEKKLDIALMYYLKDGCDKYTVKPISYDDMKKMDLDEEKLRALAWNNTFAYQKAVIRPLVDLLNIESDDECPLYVMSNQDMYLGAVCLFFPGILEFLSKQFESDLCILPSSIHEVLVLPKDETTDIKKLKQIVKKVNDFDVVEDERLSYNVYIYNKALDSLSIDNN